MKDNPGPRRPLLKSDVQVGDRVMIQMLLHGRDVHLPAAVLSVACWKSHRPSPAEPRIQVLKVNVDDEDAAAYGIDNPVEIREPYVAKDRILGCLTIERAGGDAVDDEIEGVVSELLGEQEPPDDKPLVQRGMTFSQRVEDVARHFGQFHGDLMGQLPGGPSEIKDLLRRMELSLTKLGGLIKNEGL